MLAEQKKAIYDLLRAASGCVLGYRAAGLEADRVEFFDDPPAAPAPAAAQSPREKDIGEDFSLESIARRIRECARCPLCAERKNAVPGMGAPSPAVLVVGEGPGAEEDEAGLPFVGPSGRLLDKMLSAISLDRNVNCYIANIVKCRPPKNRTPYPEEAEACEPFLESQINALKPKMILAMGRCAAQNLLKTDAPLSSLRGRWFDRSGVPVMATYHPSALLRDASLKRGAWDDLKIFRARLERDAAGYDANFVKRDLP